MSKKRYIVPRGMLKEAVEDLIDCWDCIPSTTDYSTKAVKLATAAVEGTLRWLSENPLHPTDSQLREMVGDVQSSIGVNEWKAATEWRRMGKLWDEWQRRMFIAPVDPRREKIIGVLSQSLGHASGLHPVDSWADAILVALDEEKK